MWIDMTRMVGTTPGLPAEGTQDFGPRQLAKRYLKCEERSLSGSEATDHRAGWWACGLFSERGE